MIELKPCPFCGGEARIDIHIFHGLSDTFGVICKCCDAETAQFYATEQEAIGAWNKRADVEERPHGHWIFNQHRWICSECRENPTFGMGYVQSEINLYAYCPNCGANMDEVIDE